MIIDLEKFIRREKPYWEELEEILNKLEKYPDINLPFDQVTRFHYLYQRTSGDLAKIVTFSSEKRIQLYLESLVGRAFGEIHETRQKAHRLSPLHWLMATFPQTFRKHLAAFRAALAIMLVGAAFGGLAITFDPDAKETLMPFEQLMGDPSERVAQEEQDKGRKVSDLTPLSTAYMTHNTKVSIFVLALGMTYGVGTIILLFYNGVILGAVIMDYILAGETVFLTAWLLPHGSVEIPAILLAGQAGLVLARALIGWGGKSIPLNSRLRKITPDLVTLIFGVALMLVWAGIVEAFLSQYHEPVIPYEVKIGFGLVEFVLLVLFLAFAGSGKKRK